MSRKICHPSGTMCVNRTLASIGEKTNTIFCGGEDNRANVRRRFEFLYRFPTDDFYWADRPQKSKNVLLFG